jgi:TRAP transporter 4TM/12TM fusion protein
MAKELTDHTESKLTRYESLPKVGRFVCLLLFAFGIGLFVFYINSWSIRGWVLEHVRYYYLLYAAFSTCVFLTLPARKKDMTRLPWYDSVLATFVFGTCIYFSTKTWDIMFLGLLPPESNLDFALACIIIILALESGRRMGGTPFAIICLIFGVYPLFAEHMPGVLYGYTYPLRWLVGAFAFGTEGMLGITTKVMAEILLSFLIFAGVMLTSGAATFFLNIALALLGRFRGGAAKVAVLSSGFFGSLSGSGSANVVSTGSVTIPAMKQMGYPAHYSAAIEAVASTGGSIMPPVMGAIVFIMVVMTEIPYATVIGAALIPACLYYYGLLIQVDAYAAKAGLKGLPREALPSLRKTLQEGWSFLIVLIFLVVGLVYMRWGPITALYASVLMILLSYTNPNNMMTPRRIIATLAATGNLITYLMAVFLPIGIILVALSVTGSIIALTAEIVSLGGESVVLILLVSVVICWVFGMAGTGAALVPYIVLSVTAVPALVTATGLNLLGIHLFLIYYIIMAEITPPVAIFAFIAAGIAGAPPMKTAWTAVRFGAVLYFIPFFFVLNPALIMQGSVVETLYLLVLCLIGIGILASALQGYLIKVGKLDIWSRPLLVAGGFLISFPNLWATIAGFTLTVLVIVTILIRKEYTRRQITSYSQL